MMYFMSGGCTSLLHLMVEHPLLVLALGFAGFAAQVPANPGPGDRFGTSSMLTGIEKRYVKDYPQIADRFSEIRAFFGTLPNAESSEEQVATVLHWSDPCTSAKPADILADESLRKEVAWLLYLDSYSREGPKAARNLFANSASPPIPHSSAPSSPNPLITQRR